MKRVKSTHSDKVIMTPSYSQHLILQTRVRRLEIPVFRFRRIAEDVRRDLQECLLRYCQMLSDSDQGQA